MQFRPMHPHRSDAFVPETGALQRKPIDIRGGNAYNTVAEAVEAAIKNADKDDLVFIGGSNFVVGEAIPLFW